MHEIYDDLEELCGYVEHEVQKANDKLRKSNGEMTAGDVDYINKLTHTMKSLKTTMAMLGGSSYDSSYDDSYDGNTNRGSYRGGSYAGRRRDNMGRYMPERGYSRDDSMIDELRSTMRASRDENTKRELQRVISKMENM